MLHGLVRLYRFAVTLNETTHHRSTFAIYLPFHGKYFPANGVAEFQHHITLIRRIIDNLLVLYLPQRRTGNADGDTFQ